MFVVLRESIKLFHGPPSRRPFVVHEEDSCSLFGAGKKIGRKKKTGRNLSNSCDLTDFSHKFHGFNQFKTLTSYRHFSYISYQ